MAYVTVKDFIKNFKTTNTMEDACAKDWCISPMPASSLKQVAVKLHDGKTYNYACRYTATTESVALVGYSIPYNSAIVEASVNTGEMGTVVDTFEKLSINRAHAVELDYVFNQNPAKKDLTQCVKYLDLGSDSYNKTLQFGKEMAPIRPIIYYIRKVLSAASVLAHPKLVKAEDLEKAKNAILAKMVLDQDMARLEWGPPEYIGVVLADFQAPDESTLSIFSEISNVFENKEWRAIRGELGNMRNDVPKFVELEIVTEFVNKYAHFGAVSLMIRGGFSNLLSAYLSVNPPIESFLDEMLTVLDGVGYADTYEILKAYKK